LLCPIRRSWNTIGTSRTRAPCTAGPERRLDLEDVAARMDAVERDRGERFGAPRLEAAGQVVRLEPQERPREDAAAARDDPADDAPVDRATPRDVARADHQVRLALDDRGDQRGEHRRVVAEVRVHLDDHSGTAIERGAESRRDTPARDPAWLSGGERERGGRTPRARRPGGRCRPASCRRRRAASPR
jgi:hypothetical protein